MRVCEDVRQLPVRTLKGLGLAHLLVPFFFTEKKNTEQSEDSSCRFGFLSPVPFRSETNGLRPLKHILYKVQQTACSDILVKKAKAVFLYIVFGCQDDRY